jgi:hypothetical protein
VTRAATILVANILRGFYAAPTPLNEEALDSFVRKHLPYYSVPENLTYVTSIPLTSNGKINRNELSALVITRTKSESGADPSSSPIEPALESAPQVITCMENSNNDPEKQQIIIETKSSSLSSGSSSLVELPEVLPAKNGLHGLRWLRHRGFILYRRFFSIVIFANLAVACLVLYRKIKEGRYILAELATATAANLCVAVLMRSEPVVNLLFTVFCSVPVSINTHEPEVYFALNRHLDFVPSGHTPPLRENLPPRRYTQRLCNSRHHMV